LVGVELADAGGQARRPLVPQRFDGGAPGGCNRDEMRPAVGRVGDAIDAGRKPGMPLSILSNIAREAPLGSLLVAFLLGVAVARRR